MQIEVICTEVRASESGQNVRLALPRQAPKPAVDGEGNPVGHPPPLSATVALFVTSPEREALLYEASPYPGARSAAALFRLGDADLPTPSPVSTLCVPADTTPPIDVEARGLIALSRC